jgi:NADPH-dependent 2,4-dienoyl-CoA reductase/sulfur reductase-like enzyme
VLIDSSPSYQSNILSNFVLTGARSLSSLTYKWDLLASRYGVQVVQGRVTGIVPASSGIGGTVSVGTTVIPYSRLVVAPGIEFDTVPGVPTALQGYYPQAWQTGPQTTELRRQLVNMLASSGSFLMSIPAAPYRCPPGPYERACLVADYLKTVKTGCNVVVLDENASILAMMAAYSGLLYFQAKVEDLILVLAFLMITVMARVLWRHLSLKTPFA